MPSDSIHPTDDPSHLRAHPAKAVLIFVLLAVLVVLGRSRSLGEPLEADISTYVLMGDEMRQGKLLYRDLWDIKPPGLYWTYEAAMAVFHDPAWAVFALGALAAVLTLAGVMVAAARGGLWASAGAGAVFALINATPNLHANLPNTEAFINVSVAWAAALLLWMRDASPRGRIVMAVVGSILLAWATSYKPTAVVAAACLVLAHVCFSPTSGTRMRAILEMCIVPAATIVLWAVMWAVFAAQGAGQWFMSANFVATRAYAGSLGFNLFRYLREGHILPSFMWFLVPILALMVVAIVILWRTGRRREAGIGIALALGAMGMQAIQGWGFWRHGQQFWFPAIAIFGGWAGVAMYQQLSRRRWIGPSLFGLVLAWLAVHELPNYVLNADQWGFIKFHTLTQDRRTLAREIGEMLRADETFFQFGNDPGLYLYANKRPPTTALWGIHLLRGPMADELTRIAMDDLRRRPPDLLAIQDMDPINNWPPVTAEFPGAVARFFGMDKARYPLRPWREHEILKLAQREYRLIRAAPGKQGYALYVRKGSDLDARTP